MADISSPVVNPADGDEQGDAPQGDGKHVKIEQFPDGSMHYSSEVPPEPQEEGDGMMSFFTDPLNPSAGNGNSKGD